MRLLPCDDGALVKSPVAGITISRWRRDAATDGRESRTAKSWAQATVMVVEWGNCPHTRPLSAAVMVRPRWANGLCLYEFGWNAADARSSIDLGAEILAEVTETYGDPKKKRLRSMKAAVAREVLARCSFSDDTAGDPAEDARTFDAAKRALETCFPDHAELYIDRIRGWMTTGGGLR